jgi:hypothetical protein
MLQVTEYESEPKHLQFAIDQIEKYDKGVTTLRHTKKGWAVYRTDMKPMNHTEYMGKMYKESAGAL